MKTIFFQKQNISCSPHKERGTATSIYLYNIFFERKCTNNKNLEGILMCPSEINIIEINLMIPTHLFHTHQAVIV